MKVKIIKVHPNAVIPTYAKAGDAGMDLTAIDKAYDADGNVVYHIGLAMEIPQGHMGIIFPRSSNAKKDMYLTNHVGVVDSGYRGEIMLKYRPVHEHGQETKIYEVGERVGQIIILPYPTIEFEESEELSQTERGAGGYGSTGS